MTQTVRQRLQYIVSDYVTCNIGWLIFNVVRYFSLPLYYKPATLADFLLHDSNIVLGQCLIPLMMLGIYALSGFYNNPGIKSRLDQIINTATCSLTGMLIIFFVVLINDNVPERLRNYELMAMLWLLLFVPTWLMRVVINNARVSARRRGEGLIRAVVVGSKAETDRLVDRLKHVASGSDFDIVAVIEPDEEAVARTIADYNPAALVLALDQNSPTDPVMQISQLLATGIDVYVPLNLYHLVVSNPRVTSVAGEPLINLSAPGISPATANLKRVGDVVLSALALIILSPVYAALAIAVKRDSPGPIFYRQRRVGYRSREFNIIKFRTMYVDAEASGPALATTDDPRITPFGRVMRKYRLDELPQFWNVLRGEMSLVGPRPERRHYVDMIVKRAPHYCLLHRVRPGITSWGMVKYGYATSVDNMIERLRFDMIYLENISLGVDLKILFYTIRTVVTGRGV